MSYNSPTSVVIPPHIKNWLIEKAQKEERSFSEILRRILKKEYADDIKAAEKTQLTEHKSTELPAE